MRWIAFASFIVAGTAAVVAWNHSASPQAAQNRVGIKTPSAEDAAKSGYEVGVFGGGCFWCTERDFRRVKGVLATDVGYMGGRTENPTYEQVCSHSTGHVEVTRVMYDPKVISYRQIVDAFFQMHDPTQVNRQGPDVGEQYQSVIFTHSEEQAKIADQARADVAKKLRRRLATNIRPAEKYWRAEEYHQQYYERKGF